MTSTLTPAENPQEALKFFSLNTDAVVLAVFYLRKQMQEIKQKKQRRSKGWKVPSWLKPALTWLMRRLVEVIWNWLAGA